MSNFSSEELLSIVRLTLKDSVDGHRHYNPETQLYVSAENLNNEQLIEFYNHCHDEDGKFCQTDGGIVKGETVLRDSDGKAAIKPEVPSKRGKLGGSLVDPNEGTNTVDGLKGYNKKTGKPVPGSDAWLEAHGISKEVFNSRPYVKFEADKTDPALQEAFEAGSKGRAQWDRLAEQKGQEGGYIMYKHPIPDSPYGPITPQIRPNIEAVTNYGKQKQKELRYEKAKQRYKDLKEGRITPAALIKEQEAKVRKAELNLKRTKVATPEIIRAEAAKGLEDAQSNYIKAKATKDPELITQARKDVNAAKREIEHSDYKAAKFKPESAVYHAEKEVFSAKQRLSEMKEDPKGFHAAEIIRQGGLDGNGGAVKRAANAYKKTASKYLFTRGADTARIDISPDKQNAKNLTDGKGRIYFAMEGAIKNDAVLSAVKREDPTAAVVNVPSVTLWHNKTATEGEIKWFARTHGKGRQIVLIPDADGVNNPNVMRQANALASALKTGGAKEVIIATPPLKHGTKTIIDPFKLPSGVSEERKGIDDHLGGGRGTLGQLAYQTDKKVSVAQFSLAHRTREGGETGTKINRNGLKNAEAMLGAISGLAGKKGAVQASKNLLMQTSGITSAGSAIAARDKLADLGVIDVRYVFDKDVLAKSRKRVQIMPDKEVDEWVSKKIIKPLPEDRYAKDDYEASPIIVIKDPKYIVQDSDSEVGVLSDRSDWKPPKTYDGWRSPLTNKKDTTGIAIKLVDNENKTKTKKTSSPIISAPTVSKGAAKTAKQRLDQKKAPPGRRIVRTPAGAKKYGVPVGSVIPLSTGETISTGLQNISLLTSTVLLSAIMSEEDLVEFYNKCHDENGRFCEGGDKVKGKTVIDGGIETGQWPPRSGRPVTKTYEFVPGPYSGPPRQIEDVGPVKQEYEVEASDGTTIHLLDKTGLVTDRQADNLLQAQARMHEMYHLQPPRHVLVTDDKEANGSIANVRLGKSDVFTLVNQSNLDIDLASHSNPKWFMPSAQTGDTTNHDYLMTHEYGHQVDGDRNYDMGTGYYYRNPMTVDPDFNYYISDYAKKNPEGVEGYAEAFAEWHHSDGTTSNPSAIALARSEGWNGNDVVPFTPEGTGGKYGYYRRVPSSSRYDESPYYGPGFGILNMVQIDPEVKEFYNQCHDEDGKFCETEGGDGEIVSGEFGFGKAKVRTVADAGLIGSVEADGIKAKAIYEATSKNGDSIRLYDKTGRVNRRERQELLDNHVRMNDLYPLQPPRNIVVVDPDKANSRVGKESFATVYGNSPNTYVNVERLNTNLSHFKDGFQMPSAKKGNTKNLDYLLTHEYGHHVDFASHSDNGSNYHQHPLYDTPEFRNYLSSYGKSDSRGVEGYAEAFAEWNHTGGKTKNPSAIAMARYENWPGSKRRFLLSSGESRPIETYEGEVVNLTLQNPVHLAKDEIKMNPDDTEEDIYLDIPKPEKGMVIYDTFDEGGSIIEGDFEVIEPSEADKDRARKIMDEVLKELGLERKSE